VQLELSSQPNSGSPLAEPLPAGELMLHIERLGNRCAIAARRDPLVSPLSGDAALLLPGIGTDFVFQPARRCPRAPTAARICAG
jgi:hypothetical protein